MSKSETGMPARTRGWVKALLALSLGLNLAVAGLAAGAWLHESDKGPGSRRHLGLGPLASAMTAQDWKAMRPAFMALHPELSRGASALRDDYAALLAALRAGDFSPEAVQSAMAGLETQNGRRLTAAREVIGGYLAGLPAEARAQYTLRLEEALAEAEEEAARRFEKEKKKQ